MKNVLVSAPYMLPFMDRFGPVLEHFGIHPIIPEVHERLEAEEILRYAGQFEARSAVMTATTPTSSKPACPP
jgi:D-3-phosphoglycerate dehydrogenase